MPRSKPHATPATPIRAQAAKIQPRHSAEKTAGDRPAQPPLPPIVEVSPLKPSDLAERVGSGMAAFENIIIPTAAQNTAVRQMDSLRIMGLKQPEGQQRRAYRYLHHSGTGKSTCAKILRNHVEGQDGRDPAMKPVLHVTLSTTGTPKSLASSILDALGDNYSTRGEAELLLRRVRMALKELGVEIVIIDELNHFRLKSMQKDAANTIKNILSLGWVPVVLMGTTDAQSLFADNRELKNRCAPQVVLAPYDYRDTTGDLPAWTQLLGRLDEEMVRRGILRVRSGLAEPGLAEDLCRASNGLIGELHNILLAALEQVLLADEPGISHQRLVEAVDAWCIQDGTIDQNYLKLRKKK
jgi:hypothetical protein